MIFILLYFILGILFVEVGIPIIEASVTLLLTYLKIPEAKASLKISQYNVKISKLADGEEEEETFTIGFAPPTKEETNDEEEDL